MVFFEYNHKYLYSEALPPEKQFNKTPENTNPVQTKQLKELLPDKSPSPQISGKIFTNYYQDIKDENFFSGLLSDFTVDYKNKTTVLLFWEHNCGFCLLTLPKINKLNEKFKDKNIAFYAVNPKALNRKNKFVSFLNNYKHQQIKFNETTGEFSSSIDTTVNNFLNVPILFIDEKIQKDFLVTGFPTTYVIDKDGLIYTAMTGYFKEYDEWLEFLLVNMPDNK